MLKKLKPFLFIVIFLSSFQLVYANLTINEIMYDLSGSDSTNSKSREWVEIYNPDASSVSIDASSWRIYDGAANRTINGQVNFSIPAGAYVIFAGDKDTFLADHAGFAGTVYDTGITSLNNTGATLKILDQDGNAVDSVAYTSGQGGAGDGNSLQKISGSWAGALPTPGLTNETVSSPPQPQPPSIDVDTGGIVREESSSAATSKATESTKIKTEIIVTNFVLAGTPLSFQAQAFGYNKEELHYGKYFWNFGDGDSKEMQTNSPEKLTHTYLYPGDYIVSLEYYTNKYSNVSDASDKMTIKVMGAEILISNVGDERDFFVELTNNANYDADISSWILSSDTKTFIFPKNTVISSKKKITISGNLTHFSTDDKNSLKLITEQGKIVFDYGASSIIPVADVPPLLVEEVAGGGDSKKLPPRSDQSRSTPPSKGGEEPEVIPLPEADILAPDLEASVAESDSDNSYMPMIASTIVIGASAGAVYFIRRNRISGSTAGNDFKILDE